MTHDLSHILNHLGEDREAGWNAVVPPVVQSGNFTYPTVATLSEAIRNEYERPLYTRGANPTVVLARKKLAALEHAEDALLFSSGSAAIAAAIISFVKAGDHVVCVQKPYNWTRKLLAELLDRFNVGTTFVDGRDPENFRKAMRPNTRLFVLESPNSMTFELQDLSAVAAIAKQHGIITLCDNSYSSPLFQNPVDLGIDIVAHSGTKYLNGHSDVVCGVLAGRKDHMRQVMQSEFMTLGAVPSPHDAWLLVRGLRTLELRMQRSADGAERVAAFLAEHPNVVELNWPYRKDHPQLELAKRQMKRCAGLMSIRVQNGAAGAERFSNALQRFLMAVSWGGYESLQFPVCATSSTELPLDLVRLYIGLEDPDLLIADLEQALQAV